MSVAKKASTRTQTISEAGNPPLKHTVRNVNCRNLIDVIHREPDCQVIVHPPVDVKTGPRDIGRTRSNPIVYEVKELLLTYGYLPVRLSEPAIPINLIGLRGSESLLICALRSRLPVPNAAKLHELFTGKVDYLRGLAVRLKDRIMIWVYSPACGWRYYLVYPGGLRNDLDFPRSLE